MVNVRGLGLIGLGLYSANLSQAARCLRVLFDRESETPVDQSKDQRGRKTMNDRVR